MKLAILFWFYDHFDLCRNRLEILRTLNRDTPIFGLFGGLPCEAAEAERLLSRLLDDFYAFGDERDSRWKWKNGDLMIADWYRNRGRTLDWETVIVVQWDMLILGPIDQVFSMLKPNEILLSGLRPAAEVAKWWPWIKSDDPSTQSDLNNFIKRLRDDYNFYGDLWCCLFIVVCLPRRFLDLYVKAGPPEEGFLEYKVPTMARMFGISLCLDHSFDPWWAANPSTRRAPPSKRVLNAVGEEVPTDIIIHEAITNGVKVFHPYRRSFPVETACRLADGTDIPTTHRHRLQRTGSLQRIAGRLRSWLSKRLTSSRRGTR